VGDAIVDFKSVMRDRCDASAAVMATPATVPVLHSHHRFRRERDNARYRVNAPMNGYSSSHVLPVASRRQLPGAFGLITQWEKVEEASGKALINFAVALQVCGICKRQRGCVARSKP
jgi:hypothetical protein